MSTNISLITMNRIEGVHVDKLETPSRSNYLRFEIKDRDGNSWEATTITIVGLPDDAHAVLVEALMKAQKMTGGKPFPTPEQIAAAR